MTITIPVTRAAVSGRAAGSGAGQRRSNGVQTSGRDYRELSEAEFGVARTNSVLVPTRGGTRLHADVFLPTTAAPHANNSTDGSVPADAAIDVAPALVSCSCYPRQVQDLGAPLGFPHTPIAQASVHTVHSSSRLPLPVLNATSGG